MKSTPFNKISFNSKQPTMGSSSSFPKQSKFQQPQTYSLQHQHQRTISTLIYTNNPKQPDEISSLSNSTINFNEENDNKYHKQPGQHNYEIKVSTWTPSFKKNCKGSSRPHQNKQIQQFILEDDIQSQLGQSYTEIRSIQPLSESNLLSYNYSNSILHQSEIKKYSKKHPENDCRQKVIVKGNQQEQIYIEIKNILHDLKSKEYIQHIQNFHSVKVISMYTCLEQYIKLLENINNNQNKPSENKIHDKALESYLSPPTQKITINLLLEKYMRSQQDHSKLCQIIRDIEIQHKYQLTKVQEIWEKQIQKINEKMNKFQASFYQIINKMQNTTIKFINHRSSLRKLHDKIHENIGKRVTVSKEKQNKYLKEIQINQLQKSACKSNYELLCQR